MHYLKALILISSTLSSAVLGLAVTSPSSTGGQQEPDRWIAYNDIGTRTDLDLFQTPDGNYTNGLAESRTPIEVCERILTAVSHYCAILNNTYSFARAVASVIKSQSDKNDCGETSGTMQGFKYVYYATGRNCDSTAQQDTIEGAIYHFLTTVDYSSICGTECLKLDHGGTWEGYLKLGSEDRFDDGAYCGPTLSYTSCASGGNNDI
ncbi:hypothetical protein BDW59DRAFT_168003 [Aspergillus cavernicola]|uniref:Secreted protein CSS2 C-terminal domain-containing protein n=1 Tax=Aspergillus cavernicola TaxID=176166 RepID=A0ABR4H8A2_9EURO